MATAVAGLLACAPAYATEPSVDAYAGEAAVLGKPTHKAHRPVPSSASGGAGTRETSTHGSGTSTGAGSSTDTGSSSGGSSAGGGSASGASGTSSRGGSGTTGTAGGGSSSAPSGGGKTASGAASGVPSIFPAASAGGSSLSVLDIVLIVLGISLVAITAVLLRRASHTAK